MPLSPDDIAQLDLLGNTLYRQLCDYCWAEREVTSGQVMVVVASALRYMCLHLGGRDKTSAQMILDDIYHWTSAQMLGDLLTGHIQPTHGLDAEVSMVPIAEDDEEGG